MLQSRAPRAAPALCSEIGPRRHPPHVVLTGHGVHSVALRDMKGGGPLFKQMRSAMRLQRLRIPITAVLIGLLLTGAANAWHSTDMSGTLPPLAFTMTRASDGKTVTADDFKGKVVLVDFGYTFCPDVCPATLLNIATMLKSLGKSADDVRVLFVTVDPGRDTLPVLKEYTQAFAPQIVGLRGTPDQLATLAKRYRTAYSVKPAQNDKDYEVTHGAAVYVFNRAGDLKLLFTGLSAPNTKLDGMSADLQAMVAGAGGRSWWHRLLGQL
jgi:protein SCO1/2